MKTSKEESAFDGFHVLWFLHGLFDCFDMTRIWNTHQTLSSFFFVHLTSFLADSWHLLFS